MKLNKPIERRAVVDSSSLPKALHPMVRSCYAARGATAGADFDLELRDLIPLREFGALISAADLVLTHLSRRILIVGDFDADGATSTALVIRCLREFGCDDVSYLVPNRFEFGYGLSSPLAEIAIQNAPTLIITVDNGISSVGGVALARAAGVDVLITDHHLPPDELPNATVILNPNMPDEPFPGKALAGVGVAFYLMAAVGRRLDEEGRVGMAKIAARYLDLVALGTVADVVPLDRNNRILIRQGLNRIRAGKTVDGVLALLSESGRDYRSVVASDLGFAVGPRLNAAGRLEDMSIGIETLLSDAPREARELAARLSEINRARRTIEKSMQEDALSRLDVVLASTNEPGAMPLCLALHDKSWHQGVVGLVASRLKDRVHRPVFAFAEIGDGQLKGSGRSVRGVHLRDLLAWIDSRRQGLITRFGGHAMAAGLTMAGENLDDFASLLSEGCEKLFPDVDFKGRWLSDGELRDDTLNIEFAEELRAAGPWGQAFPEPLFDGRFVLDDARVVGHTHLKMRVRSLCGERSIDAIAFGQGEIAPLPVGVELNLVYRLDVNEFRGIRSVQLLVEQIEVI